MCYTWHFFFVICWNDRINHASYAETFQRTRTHNTTQDEKKARTYRRNYCRKHRRWKENEARTKQTRRIDTYHLLTRMNVDFLAYAITWQVHYKTPHDLSIVSSWQIDDARWINETFLFLFSDFDFYELWNHTESIGSNELSVTHFSLPTRIRWYLHRMFSSRLYFYSYTVISYSQFYVETE